MCELRRRRRAPGYGRAKANRIAPHRGWFAHRCGVSRCGQVFVPERLTHEETTWRGDE